RHTRFSRDWSSDVCSSDLDVENYCRYLKRHGLHKKIEGVTVAAPKILKGTSPRGLARMLEGRTLARARRHGKHLFAQVDDGRWRSEERRVGKEGRCGWAAH